MGRTTRLASAIVLATVAGCSGTSAPGAVESIPPPPAAAVGWQSITAFGGSGPGVTGALVEVSDGGIAVHASCAGSGTLVVTVSAVQPSADQGVQAPAAVFECGDQESVATSRVELEGVPAGEVTASAFVAEGGGTTRHAAFNVSIEQPAGAAGD